MSALGFLFAGRRKVPDVRQAEAAECGLACLAMISGYYGREASLNSLRRAHPVSLKGVTLKTLMNAAEVLGFATRPLRVDLAHLQSLRLPAIVHWDMTHYVVLVEAGARHVRIHDPALGPRDYPMADVSKHFTGVALELVPQPVYTPPPKVPRLTLGALLGPVAALRSTILQVVALSIVLQVYVLFAPFYMQLVVDHGVALGDRSFIGALAVGFAILLLINAGAVQLRATITANLQRTLSFQIGAGLFHKLLSLPVSYFEKRHIGDLVSRFQSAEPARRLIEEGVVTAAIDGAMALLTATMIILYSPMLTAIVVAALAAYVLLRVMFLQRSREQALDLMVARAKESSTFIETARAIQAIKLFNREVERGAVWLNRYADVVRSDARLQLSRQTFQNLNDIVFGLENVAVVYFGARAVLDQQMTVGMLFAFVAYKQQFIGKMASLVEKAIEFRLLDLHLDRLADVTGADPEPASLPQHFQGEPLRGEIEVRNLSFRYAAGEPYVFENVSFRIAAGDYVAITGPSGCGKTTLMKIMLGLVPPTSGEVLVDGRPLQSIGRAAYRSQIGAVMQDDVLLSGTIAENIAFFDATPDRQKMMHCAKLAAIDEAVAAMPMTYESLIGDMGTSLSGGQRQRILLARALYRSPRLLFMDEGTSSLDVETEMRVSAAVRDLGLTRIVIAHRPETIASANRQIALHASLPHLEEALT